MKPKERIPLHDHFDNNSGGKLTANGLAPGVLGSGGTTTGVAGEHSHAIDSDALKVAGHWEPVTDGDVATPEMVFEDGDIVMQWVTT